MSSESGAVFFFISCFGRREWSGVHTSHQLDLGFTVRRHALKQSKRIAHAVARVRGERRW